MVWLVLEWQIAVVKKGGVGGGGAYCTSAVHVLRNVWVRGIIAYYVAESRFLPDLDTLSVGT